VQIRGGGNCVTRDHAIASAIVEFSKFVKEFQKLKLQMMETITSQILENKNKGKEMFFCNAKCNW
jgi:hypothetical protein